MKSNTVNNLIFGAGISNKDGSDKPAIPFNNYRYLTGVVTDCITVSPSAFLRKKFVKNSDFRKSIKNIHMLNKAPINSIIVCLVDNGKNMSAFENFVALPFFSSHLSMPVKPGEYVWLLEENNENNRVFYWMCRKHGISQVDDVNYTFLERTDTIENEIKIRSREQTLGKKKQGLAGNDLNEFIQSFHSYLPGQINNTIFETKDLENNNILKKSVGHKITFKQEIVPKKSKKPGDLLLQGSNNSLIELTTEKFKNALSLDDIIDVNEPAIDICIGRKKKELNAIREELSTLNSSVIESSAENTKIRAVQPIQNADSPENNIYELDKTRDILEGNELVTDFKDIDPLNCGGRIYLSNKCSIDQLFDTAVDGLDEKEGSSLAIYSNHVRISANDCIRIVNNSINNSFLALENKESYPIMLGRKNQQKNLEPFVRGFELANLLDNLLTQLIEFMELIKTAFSSNVSPGLGLPNVPLKLTAEFIDFYIEPLQTLKDETLEKILSNTIKGE